MASDLTTGRVGIRDGLNHVQPEPGAYAGDLLDVEDPLRPQRLSHLGWGHAGHLADRRLAEPLHANLVAENAGEGLRERAGLWGGSTGHGLKLSDDREPALDISGSIYIDSAEHGGSPRSKPRPRHSTAQRGAP